MGFVGLLQFAVKYCVGVLAWPVIALGYPLCASIKSIETDSVSDTQKLNTYWIVFSVILLLEHVFGKFLGWLVLWPYMRLMIVCWLVIPYFDGAFYIYKHLIRPCLSVDPQIVINWFDKRKESSYVKDNILTEMERYVKENGPETLEKILASKSGSTESNLDVQEIESVSSIANKVVEKSGSTKPKLDVQEIKSVLSIENKAVEEMKFQTLLFGDLKDLDPGSPNVIQKDIKPVEVLEKKEARAAEQMLTVTGDNSDQMKFQTLLFGDLKDLYSGSPNVIQNDIKPVEVLGKKEVRAAEQMEFQTLLFGDLKDLYSGSPNIIQNDIKPVEVLGKKEVRAAEQVSRVEPNLTQVENRNFAAPEIEKMVPEVVVAAHRELPKTPAPPDHEVQKWTCKVCQVTFTSGNTLKCHYYGKKHKAALEALEAKTRPKDVPTSIPKNSDPMEPRNSANSKGCFNNVEVQGQPQNIHASAARKSRTRSRASKKGEHQQ